MGQQPFDLGVQGLQVLQIHDPDGAAPDLVFIGRSDAALGGADLAGACGGFAQGIEFAVQRQDQGRVFRNPQVGARHLHALLCQAGDLVGQRPGVDHDPIADDRELARPHDAGRQQ